MCEFFSCIITKKKEFLFLPNDMSHDKIIEANKLQDTEQDADKLTFARVEILPPDNNVFETDLSKWTVNIDQSITPNWWNENLMEFALKKFGEVFDKFVFIDKKDIQIENHNCYLKNSNAEVITNGTSRAAVRTYGTSSAVVRTNGTSRAVVRTNDTSSAEVITNGTSRAEVITYGTSRAVVRTNDTSSAEVITNGTSSAVVITNGTSRAEVRTYGTSSAVVIEVKFKSIALLNNKLYICKVNNWEIKQI